LLEVTMSIQFFNSRIPAQRGISLEDAILRGQAENAGLFIPEQLPKVSEKFLAQISSLSDQQIVEEIASLWLDGSVPRDVARKVAHEAIDFETPLIQLGPSDFILELFHGPTLAFKDYGARFLARILSYFLMNTGEKQTILVATSGDTGSAVAAGFLDAPNIRVIVLYPGGRVSDLQEMQMTTLGKNTFALKVDGNFDDCQKLVKTAFADEELRVKLALNSANSINIGRLIAQTFYYFIAYARLKKNTAPVFVVPSGNLGNLCAGIFAKKMGLPVAHFVAGTNANDVFVEYLSSGTYNPRPSVGTMSNAMDVAAPSNLERLLWVYDQNVDKMREEVCAYAINDKETADKIQSVADQDGYILDPHTAVGCCALKRYRTHSGELNQPGIVLSTAHPAKFRESVEAIVAKTLALPPALEKLQSKSKHIIPIENSWDVLRKWLLKI
jgi:threonine synthase